ncbi:MAG: leucine-rich repeat protein [Paludibacter sp.]|nr:leucine-rich repeat protein [Paludibacter sp.]
MKANYTFKGAVLALCFLVLPLQAQNLINGINYAIINEGAAVEVAPLPKEGDTDVRYTQASLVIPASVEIGGVTYPVKRIGNNALRNNNNLVSLTLPEGLEVIGNSSLAQCESLPSVVVPSTVNSIEDWAFYGCFALESINFPEGMTTITEHTFQQSGLKSVVLPSTVTSLKVCAFQDAKNLASINLENVTEIVAWSLYGTALSDVVVNNVASIGDCAFARIPTLESIELNNVGELRGWMFQDCTKLKTVKMSGTEILNQGTFSGCSALTEITIPSSVAFIDDWSFEKTAITKIFASWANPATDVVINPNAFGSDEGKINFTWYVPESVYWGWDDFFMGYLVDLFTSVNTIELEDGSVNYLQGILNVENLDGFNVTVYAIDGRSMGSFAVLGESMQQPMHLTSGVYLLHATKGAEKATAKFAVR